MELTGKVIKKVIGQGSKSQREAVAIVTGAGEFVLRRAGGNAFFDEELEWLVGKSIRAEAVQHDYTMILSHWVVLDDDPPSAP